MTQPAMDATAFAEMKEMMGDTFNDVVSLSIETLPQQLDAIEKAIKASDAETLFSTAHKMKSASGTIGAFGLAECAEAVELIGRSASTDVPAEKLQALRKAIDEVVAILQKETRKTI